MQGNIEFLSVILILGAIQGHFLSLLLFIKHRKLLANRILAVLIFLYTVFVIGALLSNLKIYDRFPHLMVTIGALPLVFGPLHYLYTKHLISPGLKFKRSNWLHFLPFVFYKFYTLPSYLMGASELREFIKNMQTYKELSVFTVVNWFVVFQGLTYMILSLYLIAGYSGRLKDAFSFLEKINLSWLRNITIMATLIWLWVLFENLMATFFAKIEFKPNPIAIATSIYVYALGYIGFFKSEIFSQGYINRSLSQMSDIYHETTLPSDAHSTTSNAEIAKRKYAKSGLSEDKASEYLDKIQKIMKHEKPYTNSNLTLQQLSEKLSISPHNLSEVINSKFKKNFFDFVNHYRIEEVKTRLNDSRYQQYTILSIAFDAGFNSKSSFNSIFKRCTNMTPSEYRKTLN